jgi:tryptophan synthase beta chain
MAEDLINSFMTGPDESGRFGDFGGRFVAETLMPLILDLERPMGRGQADPAFQAEIAGAAPLCRPALPLYFAERLTKHLGGAKIYFKRDELNHTGSHKINNCLGQILLAKRMGKTRIIAETGAGQHGVATATVCARFGCPASSTWARPTSSGRPNVFRMKLLGAEVRPVTAGTAR